MAKFKVGDQVKSTSYPGTDIVESMPGDNEYDRIGYADASAGFFLKDRGWEYQEDWELVEQTYTKLTPKVGDRFRVIKRISRLLPEGFITKVVREADNGCQFTDTDHDLNALFSITKSLTTEYLEPVEEECDCHSLKHGTIIKLDESGKCKCGRINRGVQPVEEEKEWSKMQMKDIERFEKHSTPTRLTTNIYEHHRNIQKELNKTNQTTMQKLTSALKRVLSADKQTLYKVGVIGQDLTLTSSGRNEYIDALFENEGDHKKAVTQMVEDAQEYLDEEKD